MTSSIVAPQPEAARPRPERWLYRFVALLPLWVMVAEALFAPTYFGGFQESPPDIVGIPLGVALTGAAFAWMLIGVAIVWNARSRLTEALGLLLFTIPATLVAVLGPAVIVIMQNLG